MIRRIRFESPTKTLPSAELVMVTNEKNRDDPISVLHSLGFKHANDLG